MKSMCLMAHEEEDTEKVNSDSETLTIEQWESEYVALYAKFKKIRSENKQLKRKVESMSHGDVTSEKFVELTKTCASLKSENEAMVEKIKNHEETELHLKNELEKIKDAQILNLEKEDRIHDLESENEKMINDNKILRDQIFVCHEKLDQSNQKILTLNQEIDKLIDDLAKFVKGKDNLEKVLGTRINFRKEGIGYEPIKKKSFENKVTTSFISFVPAKGDKPIMHEKASASSNSKPQKFTGRNKGNSRRRRTFCHYCGRVGHVMSYCNIMSQDDEYFAHKSRNSFMFNRSHKHGPNLMWVPKVVP